LGTGAIIKDLAKGNHTESIEKAKNMIDLLLISDPGSSGLPQTAADQLQRKPD
jgi:hypothetical protein